MEKNIKIALMFMINLLMKFNKQLIKKKTLIFNSQKVKIIKYSRSTYRIISNSIKELNYHFEKQH